MHALSPAMLVFDPKVLLDSLRNLDAHLSWLCPVFWSHGSFALVLLLAVLALLAAKRRWAEAIALLAAMASLFYALGIPKIDDGSSAVTLPYSRAFLAVPLLLAISFSFCSDLIKRTTTVSACLLAAAIISLGIKVCNLDAIAKKEESITTAEVQLRRVDEVRKTCAQINAAGKTKADLIVALPPVNCTYAEANFDCMGGEILFPDYPKTLIYGSDRRSWRADVEMTNISRNILFIGGSRSAWRWPDGPDVPACGEGELVLHIVNNSNGLTLPELLGRLKAVR
jgi:hypothetical protein